MKTILKALLFFALFCSSVQAATVFKDRVRETTSTSGQNDITLGGAVTKYRTFASALSDGDYVPVVIVHTSQNQWQVCYAYFRAATNKLEISAVKTNSAGTQPTKLSFAAGTKEVWIDLIADAIDNFASGGGSGTVTSAGISTNASYLTVGSSPITTSGTITLNKTTGLTANRVVATPDGVSGTADLRALVAADIPNLDASKITTGLAAIATSGSASDLTAGTAAIARGGTNSGTALSGSSIMVSNGSAIVQGSAGTSTTVLHGNAAGTPSYSAVDLTADVSGILPSANGGTGNGFTKFSGPATSEKTFTLPDASASILTDNTAVTVAQGGTGQTSYTNGQLLIGNTVGNTLTKATLTQGSGVTITNGNGSITISATGTGGTVTSAGLSTDTDFLTVASSPITTSGTITLNKTTGLAANKVVATPDGTTGGVSVRSLVAADIPSLDASKIGSGILASTYGGTGNGFTKFSGPATTEKTFTLPNASSTILTDNAAVTVAQGGTGITSGTSGGIPYFSGTGTISSSAALTANQIVLGGGAGTTPATLGSLGTTTTVLHGNAAGAPSFSAIVNSDITNGTIDLTTKVTGILPSANGGTANGFTKFTGPATAEKTFTLPNASATILTDNAAVTVGQGGTGQTSYTNGQLLIGNTTGNTLTKATLTQGSGVTITNGAGSITIAATGSGLSRGAAQGRLTLTSATPVLTSTVSGATTVYYALYLGDQVPLYDGSNWTYTTFTELSQATTDSTKSPAACTTNSNYDMFVWSDGGTIRCTRGPAWSSSTSRGTGAGTTELERVNGIWVNKIAITNGPGAQRGTYVGTIRTNGTSTVDWIIGGLAASGTAGVGGVWNMYNRVDAVFNVQDTTNSWTLASTATQAANNSATMRVSLVLGLDEDAVYSSYSCYASAGASGTATVGVCLDNTNAFSGPTGVTNNSTPATITGFYSKNVGIGFHFLSATEGANTGGTSTFYGDNGAPSYNQNGLIVRMKM